MTQSKVIFEALEQFRIELPSWGFADTGTRFGKYLQPAAAVTIAEKNPGRRSASDHRSVPDRADLVRAESCLQDAFATDVRPAIREWRVSKGLPSDPMQAFRDSAYLERITAERGPRKSANVSTYA